MKQNGNNREVHFTPSMNVTYATLATRTKDTTPPVAVLSGNALEKITIG
jgi:hypothetical protein